MVGGGMRQAGILAAAGIYALQNNVKRLAEDHRHAKQLAQRLQGIEELSINQDLVQTNMLFVKTRMDTAESLAKFLKDKGITIIPAETMRWVMHLNISDKDVDYIEEQVKVFFA